MTENLKILSDKHCIIGEGPIWNAAENVLYFTNGMGGEICRYFPEKDLLESFPAPFGCAAFAFDMTGRLIVSCSDGVWYLAGDGSRTPLYDTTTYTILYANDMKVGPDGCLYVGTQSGKRKGVSDRIDGRLYRISPDGGVAVLLDGLILSNGMEWSMDEKRFYHTDSDTQIIREYEFSPEGITLTGRELCVPGVDGFTIDRADILHVGCWGKGHIALVDTHTMTRIGEIPVPAKIPTSCGFFGRNQQMLAVTTATYGMKPETVGDADGCTVLIPREVGGRTPYLFGRT